MLHTFPDFQGGAGTGGIKDLDYDPRCFFDDCYLLQSGKVNKVVNICSVIMRLLIRFRRFVNTKDKMMQDMLDRCIEIVDDYRSGKYDPVKDVELSFFRN